MLKSNLSHSVLYFTDMTDINDATYRQGTVMH